MGRSSRCLAAGILCALAVTAAPAAASEWAPGDVEAARRYQRQERERAERYRAAIAERAEAAVPKRAAAEVGVVQKQAAAGTRGRARAPEVAGADGGFVARVSSELRDALLGSLRGVAAALAAEFEPWARELAHDLFASVRRAVASAWCEASAGESCVRA